MKTNAADILRKSAQHIEDRAAARDQPEGERSMPRTVAAFNALTGHTVSERDGWLFMAVLKAARACTTPAGKPDDYEDLAAYAALAGECVADSDEVAAADEDERVHPGWAKWKAQDADGEWYVFAERPECATNGWVAGGRSELSYSEAPNPNWRNTLQAVNQ